MENAYDKTMPLSLTFEEDGAIRVQLGNAASTLLEYARFNRFAFLQGQFSGALKTYESQELEETNIRIKLRLDQDKLYGYASSPFSSSLGTFNIPAPPPRAW